MDCDGRDNGSRNSCCSLFLLKTCIGGGGLFAKGAYQNKTFLCIMLVIMIDIFGGEFDQ